MNVCMIGTRLRGPRDRRLLRRVRRERGVRRQGRREDRRARARRDPDLRARPRGDRRAQRVPGPAALHHRHRRGDPRRARALHRGADAAARGRLHGPRRRRGRWRARSAARWTATRWSSPRARCRSAPPTGCASWIGEELRRGGQGDPLQRGLEPRVPARGRRDRRLHAPRPRRDRRRRRRGARRS